MPYIIQYAGVVLQNINSVYTNFIKNDFNLRIIFAHGFNIPSKLDDFLLLAKFDFKIAFFIVLCIISVIGLNSFSNKAE